MPVSKPSSALRLAVIAALCLASRSLAGSPRDELLRFVPERAGFCLVVQNLRTQVRDLLDSPFAQAWSKSAQAGEIARAAEWKQIDKVEEYLIKNLGVGWPALRDDILGEAFVFAYQPGPMGKPDQEQGLFLLRARNARTLATLVDKLNELQKGTGELKELVTREHKGVKYVCRVESKTTNYYLLRGPVLLYTGQESYLQQAIERDKALADSEPPLAQRLKDLGLDRAMLALTIQPRAFDDAMAGKSAVDPGTKMIGSWWKALDAIGVGVHLERDLRLSLTVKARTEQLPASARRFLACAGQSSELSSSFPENALLAATGRLDLPALYDLVGELLSRPSRETLSAGLERGVGAVLGKDIVKEVLPAFGPDWGLCVLPPPAGSKHWAPRMIFAVRMAAGEGSDPIDQALLTGVHTWAQMAVLGHNRQFPEQVISLRTMMLDKVKVRYLQGDAAFPAGIRPAFALKSGYLLFASSPEEIQRFKVAPVTSNGISSLLRVSLKDLRAYLDAYRDGLTTALASRDGITREMAGKKIDNLRRSVELIDRIELSQKVTPGQVALTLSVQTAQAMKK